MPAKSLSATVLPSASGSVNAGAALPSSMAIVLLHAARDRSPQLAVRLIGSRFVPRNPCKSFETSHTTARTSRAMGRCCQQRSTPLPGRAGRPRSGTRGTNLAGASDRALQAPHGRPARAPDGARPHRPARRAGRTPARRSRRRRDQDRAAGRRSRIVWRPLSPATSPRPIAHCRFSIATPTSAARSSICTTAKAPRASPTCAAAPTCCWRTTGRIAARCSTSLPRRCASAIHSSCT